MKISKALGFGLLLHVPLILVLVIQPSCTTMDPPTQTYQQSRNLNLLTSDSPNASGSFEGLSSELDPVFNAGLSSDSQGRFKPTRPDAEFSEFEGITPGLKPILSDSGASTVEIAGPSFKTYTVIKGDSLWAISRRHSVSLEDLYAANGLNKNSVLSIGQQIKIPAEGSVATINTITANTYQPTSFNMESRTYTVVRGDTLSHIAKRFNTSVNMIKSVNNKNSDKILIGEKLMIPVEGRTSDYSRSSVPAAKSGSSPKRSSSTEDVQVHIVKVGEFPATIARQYGITASELLAMNGITDPYTIQVGQKLRVSSKRSDSADDSTARTRSTSTVAPAASKSETRTDGKAPVAIRIIEADPLIESNDDEVDPDSMFENVEEMPVVPLNE